MNDAVAMVFDALSSEEIAAGGENILVNPACGWALTCSWKGGSGVGLTDYTVVHKNSANGSISSWNDPFWGDVPFLVVDNFRLESSDHHPLVKFRLVHTPGELVGIFAVDDRYVLCLAQEFQEPVCRDSCVELFLMPPGGLGYITFEFSANGTLLLYHIVDCRRTPDGFAEYTKIPAPWGRQVQIFSSLTGVIDPEISSNTPWTVAFRIPLSLLEQVFGRAGLPTMAPVWRANVNKCADGSSHPHWATWAPIDALNFHQPHCFGLFHFAQPVASINT